MTKKQANYRLDEILLEALSERATSEGLKATDIVERALQQYLGFTIQNPVQIDSNNDERIAFMLDERIAVLRNEYDNAIATKLLPLENQINQLDIRMRAIPDDMQSSLEPIHSQLQELREATAVTAKKPLMLSPQLKAIAFQKMSQAA